MTNQPIRFLIPTIGSRGDIQPYIALAQCLDQAGHQAVVATHPTMRDLVESYQVRFAPIGPDIDIGFEAAKIRANAPHWMLGFMRVMKFTFRMLEASHDDIKKLARESQVMIVSHTAAGSIEADQLDLRQISVTLFPQAIPVKDESEPLHKRLIGAVAGWGMGLMMQRPLNRIRKRLGLPPMGPEGITSQRLNLIPMSPNVIPPDPRWEPRHQMTGYWFTETPQTWEPPDDLVSFLAAGAPPIVINLGAMALGDEHDQAIIDLTVEAIRRAGVRAIIQGWHQQLASMRLPGDVFHLGPAPHSWLLPKAQAFIHHGGFGSTATAFREGIPSLAIPHIIDQFIWGQKISELGVGPKPISRTKLTEDNLSLALVELAETHSYKENAASLGDLIRAEKGLQTALQLIEEACQDLA